MEKIYNPTNIEEPIYKFWEQKGYFKPNTNINKDSYCIIMPPPNITGQLHLGHAFQHTIMDILIRYQRMQGKNTLWQTGIDHAGIITQILVENDINNNINKTAQQYTENQLIQQAWKWKKKSEKFIHYQMKRLGNSVNWESTRFTMDADMSYAVEEAFIHLYNNNLIYKGQRLVNWDPKLKTAISDLEVINKKTRGTMWYIRYLLDNSVSNHENITNKKNYITIATTRPETMLGDTAIAIHPNDTRYNKLIGQHAIIPIINKRIPIISNTKIDMNKGTGCVKITPAHSFNDYTIGKAHNLPIIKIISHDGKILNKPEIFSFKEHTNNPLNYDIPKIFHNLNIQCAREKIIAECNKHNLVDSYQAYDMTIACNDRTGTIIEPMITDQWYIRTKNLAQQAINIVKEDKIKFIPKKYRKMYFDWMNNIQDWCISRQIWWGHKLPIWYDKHKIEYVGHSEKEIRIKYKLSNNIILHRDKNILDTWFSSGLWAFSSLGWPNNNSLLNTFYPSNVIISGFDIIFFWIARMIMLSTCLVKNTSEKNIKIPFQNVYITGLIRDEYGQKMSKSKGNTIDPLDLIDGISIENLLKKRTKNILQSQLAKTIEKNTKKQFPNGIKPHGSDAVRFTLTTLASYGRDIHWDMSKLKGYHNFCNKLWNASQFILQNTKNKDCGIHDNEKLFSLADRWIVTKFYQTIQYFVKQIETYQFDKAANILYEFVWNQFCDWYIEFTKSTISHGNIKEVRGTRYTLITLLESLLRLAHPIIPFITEKIWQEIKTIAGKKGDTIMLQPFPKGNTSAIDNQSIIDLERIKNIILSIRSVRSNTLYLTPNIAVDIIFKKINEENKQLIINNYHSLLKIARLNKIHFTKNTKILLKSIPIPLDNDSIKLSMLIPEKFDKNITINRLHQELTIINQKIIIIKKKLNDKNFIKKTPQSFIKKENEKLNSYKKIQENLLNKYAIIKNL